MKLKGDYNLKKKGCTFNIKNNYDNVSFTSETVDKVVLKSVVLTMSSWFIVDTNTKPTRKIKKLLEKIKKTINLNLNKHYFNGMIIDVDSFPFTFEEKGTGYVVFEYTLFVNKGITFNKEEITMVINELIDVVYNEHFKHPIDFDVYKSRLEFKEELRWNPDNYYPGDETPITERL